MLSLTGCGLKEVSDDDDATASDDDDATASDDDDATASDDDDATSDDDDATSDDDDATASDDDDATASDDDDATASDDDDDSAGDDDDSAGDDDDSAGDDDDDDDDTTPTGPDCVTDFWSCNHPSQCVEVFGDCCGCANGGFSIAINTVCTAQWQALVEANFGPCAGVGCLAVYLCDGSVPRCEGGVCTYHP
jgi:hypothetical protein